MNTYRSSNSREGELRVAVDELLQEFDIGRPPSLAVVFVSPSYQHELSILAKVLGDKLDTASIVGCLGEPLVACNSIADDRCISLWAAWWPDANVELYRPQYVRQDASFSDLPNVAGGERSTLIMLSDPLSFPTDILLSEWNNSEFNAVVAGGIVSGEETDKPKFFLGQDVFSNGAVIAAIRGLNTATAVSQGCRPIGEPFVITMAERNVIVELGGKPASSQLQEIFDRLPNRDRELVRAGIQLGCAVNEYQDAFEAGDFLIRDVTEIDSDDGSITTDEYHRVGQTVQFHLRDAENASLEFSSSLQKQSAKAKYQSALVFSGEGRRSFFEEPQHDLSKVHEALGDIPANGCFFSGEIGPIGKQNFLHRFSASAILFE